MYETYTRQWKKLLFIDQIRYLKISVNQVIGVKIIIILAKRIQKSLGYLERIVRRWKTKRNKTLSQPM